MWQWIKSSIFTPIANFFSGIVMSIRKRFVSDPSRAERQPLLPDANEANVAASSIPVLQALGSPFDSLPSENIHQIAGYLSGNQNAQSAFVVACSRFYSAFQPQRLLKQFLQYVVYGNQNKAEAILNQLEKTDPDLLAQLLTQKSIAVDYSGRTIQGTALQMALGAEDVKYRDDEECMAEMLIRHLKALPNSDAIMAQQIQDQFPEDWEEAEKARQERDSAALNNVMAAIENAQEEDNCDAAIQAFRDYLEKENKGNGIIKTGKHFNTKLLTDALNLYDEKYDQFGGDWNSPKNLLFWRKIIGGIERYLPACLAQAFCQGVYQIVGNREKLNRQLAFRYTPDVTFYPLDSNPAFRLGHDYAAGAGGRVERAAWTRGAPMVYKLYQTKNINGGKIMRQQLPNTEPPSYHVVM